MDILEAGQQFPRRHPPGSLNQIGPGVLEMVGQLTATKSQAAEEEPAFPVSVAECIRALNLKAVVEAGAPFLLWKAQVPAAILVPSIGTSSPEVIERSTLLLSAWQSGRNARMQLKSVYSGAPTGTGAS